MIASKNLTGNVWVRNVKRGAVIEMLTLYDGPFSLRYTWVRHFYMDLPYDEFETPVTPKFSVMEYNLPGSDHGKQKALEKWIALIEMTPTRFFKKCCILSVHI